MHKTTDINKKRGERARTMSRTTQESAHTAMDYALKAQEINTELLRRTSQAWIEGFRYQAKLSQGMAQAFFGQWGTHEAPRGQEQSRSEVTEEPATNGAKKEVTEPAAKDAQKNTEPSANGAQKNTEIAGKDAQNKTETVAKDTQKAEKAAEETQKATEKATEKAAKSAQESTETGTFPIEGYDELNVGEVSERLDGLSVDELKRVRKYEKQNKNRGTLRKEMKQKIQTTS